MWFQTCSAVAFTTEVTELPAVDILPAVLLPLLQWYRSCLLWTSDLQCCCLYYNSNGVACCGHLTCSAVAFTTVVKELPAVGI
jgi:hypothetical protein